MKTRKGFTLTEVVIALSILLGVIVSLTTLTAKTVHVAATSDREQAAIQLVTDRTDQVRADPDYGGLDTTYAKTETSFATLPGFQRVTTVTRVTTSSNDYKKVTVTVTGPGLTSAISRTVVVAAP
ncbi:MAG TPA: prepilin-type N-terminal cleavage/methylation domain-containing protein [Gemmatimonadaceae bacterium]|jgi:prepilin-type N-terminal cleavage/methylation domain-containing protein|nr:prepilin-type N-terminal cleavage/methylation domain-containing protein [Gemmatimonadaceae bacterium]